MTTWEILQDSATYQEIVAEARLEGKLEAKLEAKLEGIRYHMERLLTMRFGPLPSWAVQRIQSAASDELDRWTAQFFSATTLEEILK